MNTEKKTSGRRCQCPTCHEYFNSSAAFDKHRVGEWTDGSCLSVDGMEGKGMSKNTAEFWITSAYDGKGRFA